MGIVVFIRSVHGRFEGYLRIARILDILGTEYILYLGSLELILDLYVWFIQRGRTSTRARTYFGITLLFLCSWDFCTYREVLFGERSTRYSTQINALHIFTVLSLFMLGYRTSGEFSLYLIIPPALTLLRNSHSLY